MFRVPFAGLLAGALLAAAGLPLAAQEKKETPKAAPKKERPPKVAVNDPAKLKDDADFAAQGEYEGTVTVGGKESKAGAQVVALGQGKFDVKFLIGGLPGAGWDGKTVETVPLAREEGRWVVKGTADTAASIADGTLTLKHASATKVPATAVLRRVERKSPTLGERPPVGATILFGGPEDVDKWAGGKVVELSDGKFLGVGVRSKQAFGSFKAHVEFRTPWMPASFGQSRGNSGVFLQDRYEAQVLDSFGLKGENNECGGIYTQHKPLVNMCLPPLAWQTYDIDFTAAGFDADGKRAKPARLTLLHNGVKVHDDVEMKGPTGGGQPEKPGPGPFQLQNHGDPVVFNNVWVIEGK